MSDNTPSANNTDDWANALAEQTAQTAAHQSAPASAHVFEQLNATPAPAAAAPLDINRILDVPVQLTVELGRTRISIKNLLQLSQGAVVELDGEAGQPLDVLINGYLIAQGEVVVVNKKYGIRLTEIISPSERILKLKQ